MSDQRQMRSLTDVVEIVMDLNGQKLAASELLSEVRHTATAAEWALWCDREIIGGIRAALRTKGANGVARYYSLNGEYLAVSLFSVEQFEQCARQHARLSRANADRVKALAEVCLDAHGRTFDAERVLREERAA